MSESKTFVFAVHWTQTKQLITPQLRLPRLDDPAAMATSFATAVAELVGLENPDIVKATLGVRNGPQLLPPLKRMEEDSDAFSQDSDAFSQDFQKNLSKWRAKRSEAWALAADYYAERGIVNVYVGLYDYWFAVYWVGSNVLIAPHVYVRTRTWDCQAMSDDLTNQVASLAKLDCNAIKLSLGSPAGLNMRLPLHRFGRARYADPVTEAKEHTLQLQTAWKQALKGPPCATRVFVTARSPTELAIHDLYCCFLRHREVDLMYNTAFDVNTQNNPKVALTALKLGRFPTVLSVLPRHLWCSKHFVLAVLSMGFNATLVSALMDPKLRNDDSDIVAALASSRSRRSASPKMQASERVVDAAVANDACAPTHACDAFKQDADVQAAAAANAKLQHITHADASSVSSLGSAFADTVEAADEE